MDATVRASAPIVTIDDESWGEMSTTDEYYGAEHGAPDGEGAGQAPSKGRVNWPTVMMAGGISAVVSAIVLAIGLVGLLLTDVGGNNNAAAQQTPTVVNLGAANQPLAQAPAAPAPAAEASAEDAPASEAPADEAPAAQAPAAEAPAAEAPAGTSAPTSSSATPSAASSTPTAPTLGQFQSDLKLLRSGASAKEKGKVLEGGTAAVAPINSLFRMADQFRAAGVRYELTGPVKQNGTTATARFKLTGPGYEPAYSTMRWVWKDGRWKLTNRSVCELAAYIQAPCNLR